MSRSDVAGAFVCDLCGMSLPTSYRSELFPRYRTAEVREVCPRCYDDVRAAWDKGKRVTDGLLDSLTHRIVRRMRSRRWKRASINQRGANG